ncbi:RNA polymerase sigma factor [Agaribacterium sp. ZY112]|uniref:RNA polymerase sigma factor n=1 Tax=Agaribacterium sp. ZY112 TaxID=3233574 RepID=UPI00352351E6
MTDAELQALYQYAMVLCQEPADAYDLVQHSLEQWLNAGKVPAGNGQQPFLRSCIRNRFIDEYRHKQRFAQQSYEEHSDYDISPIDLEELIINRQELEKIWPELALEDRDILYHWAVLGYTTDEACEQLGLARGTFLSRMHRLRKHCRLTFVRQA